MVNRAKPNKRKETEEIFILGYKIMNQSIRRLLDGTATDYNRVQNFSSIVETILEILHYLGLDNNNVNIHYTDSNTDTFIVTIKQTNKIDVMITYLLDNKIDLLYSKGYELNSKFVELFNKKFEEKSMEVICNAK